MSSVEIVELTGFNLDEARITAISHWNRTREQFLAPYFYDRLAVTTAMFGSGCIDEIRPSLLPRPHRVKNLEDQLATAPLLGNFPVDSLDSSIPAHEEAMQILNKWVQYLYERSIRIEPSNYSLSRYTSLRELYSDTVYTNGAPAINGPGFLDILGNQQSTDLLKKHGSRMVQGFCIAMTVIHERTHFYQGGEPLLCELLLAAYWTDFLQWSELNDFQFRREDGVSCITEFPYLHPNLDPNTPNMEEAMLDTRNLPRILGAAPNESNLWYESLCRLSTLMDRRKIKYKSYLKSAYAIIESITSGHSPAPRIRIPLQPD